MARITRLHKMLRSRMEKAVREYDMIRTGDRILVGVSGGPDSLSLLHLLLERCRLFDSDFSLVALHVDLGFDHVSPPVWRILEDHFRKLSLEYRIVHTQISKEALAPDAKKNPCFICAHHRRHNVYKTAHQTVCNKIAYGHHKDDIVETLLLNILFGRKIEAMNPVQEVFRGKMQIIRPLAYVEEELLKKFALESELPQLPRPCPMDGQTRRQRIKEIISRLQDQEKNANIRENIFKSLSHVNIAFRPPDERKNENQRR